MREKEAARLQAAKALCSKIKFLPTDHQTKIETARVLAVSRAGWVAFTPPQCELLKIDEAIRHVSGAFLGAAKPTRNLLLGSTTILEVVIGVRQVLLYAKRWVILVVCILQVSLRGRPSFSCHPPGGHSAIQPGPMPLAWCGIWKSSHSPTTSTRSPTCFVKVGAENNGMRLALAREEIQPFSGIPVTLRIESPWFGK